jgi:prolyl 4-hydroxylase
MVTAFKDGMAGANATVEVAEDATSFRLAVEHGLLGMRSPADEDEDRESLVAKYKQPAAYFSPEGERLGAFRDLRNRVVFLFEGGQFIWPGVRIGHKSARLHLHLHPIGRHPMTLLTDGVD